MNTSWILLLGLVVLLQTLAFAQDEGGNGQGKGKGKDGEEDDEPDMDPSVPEMFSCSRPGQICIDPEAECVEKECVCGDGWEWYDCSVNTTIPACDMKCRNKGRCVTSDADEETCFCENQFFGDKCQFQRFNHTCVHDRMVVRVAPIANNVDLGGEFSGLIYVQDYAEVDECNAKAGDDGVFELVIPYEGACGEPLNATIDDGSVELHYTVILQYDDLLVTVEDQVFDIKCLQAPSGESKNLDDKLTSDLETSETKRYEVKTELVPISLTITLEDGSPIAGPIAIGSIIKLTFKLDGGAVYSTLKLVMLEATNGREGEEAQSILLVEEGCIYPEAGPKGKGVIERMEKVDDVTVDVYIKVFKFSRGNTIDFISDAASCASMDGACNATVCDNSDFAGVGRKKRSADLKELLEEGDKLEHMTQRIYVYNPMDVNDVLNPVHYRGEQEPSFWTCVNNTNFLMIVIFFIIAVLVSLAAITVCCVRAFQQHKAASQSGSISSSYSNKAFA